jgi:carbamoyltransferase
MECDYFLRDRDLFQHVVPQPTASVRVQTVQEAALPSFRELLRKYKEATGSSMLVNTSFNGFSEPIVCTPRDAIRLFYGTGLDMLVMNDFVVLK